MPMQFLQQKISTLASESSYARSQGQKTKMSIARAVNKR